MGINCSHNHCSCYIMKNWCCHKMTKLTATRSWSGLYDFMRLFFSEGIRIQDGCQCYSVISPIKMMMYCWMSNHHKTTGIVNKCHNKQFLSLVWVFMANNNVTNEPLVSCMTPRVIFNCHLLIVECDGHKAVEYGVKYNLILFPQTIFIGNILAHLVFWVPCWRTISFLLTWLF